MEMFAVFYLLVGAATGFVAYRAFWINAEWKWWAAVPAVIASAVIWPAAWLLALYILMTRDWSR